ncbi:MAG: type II toxin-antitoxin system Phd/YefM family antitoxin [Rhodospirillales bacterium]|nr:type II toxin-antitoxin system Phd/YefM family antitoxin [Rhodospirillales bacterium]
MRKWQVQEAKARFSELLRRAGATGPQAITVRGRTAAVVVASADYERLKRKRPSLVRFLRASPLAGVDLALARDRSPPRKVEL